MALVDGLLQELEQEAQTTRRVLERVPDEQLAGGPTRKPVASVSSPCTSPWCPAAWRR